MKNLRHTGGVLFLVLVGCTHHTATTDKLPWVPFQWESECINNQIIEKTAISIPVKIADMPYQFEVQFDLGAATTMLYGNTIAPYLEKHSELKQRIDSTHCFYLQGEPCPFFSQTDLMLGEVLFPNTDLALFTNYGEVMTADSILTESIKHIGTISADLFTGGILVIDYPNERLCYLEELPEAWKKSYDFVDIEYIEDQNWIFLPLNIDNTIHKVLFDTGSSMFPLLSSPSNIATIADTQHSTDSLSVGAWGSQVTVYGYKPSGKIGLGAAIFNSLPVYSSEYLDNKTLQEAGFWGIVGNRYFLDRTIVIDYKDKKFGISRK